MSVQNQETFVAQSSRSDAWGVVSRTWRLATFWYLTERRVALLLVAALIAIVVIGVYLEVRFNRWHNDFYSAVEDRDQVKVWYQLGVNGMLALLFVVCAVSNSFVSLWCEIRWRTSMTRKLLTAWLRHHAYYRLQLTRQETDNPDQRISEDVKLFVSITLSLITQFTTSLLTLAAFLAILWRISGDFEIRWRLIDLTVPKYMVVVAFLYAIVGTLCAYRLGRALVPLNYAQQRYDADYRLDLVRLRENVEQVAFYGGERFEHASLSNRFASVCKNWYRLMWAGLRLNIFTNSFTQLSMLLPLLLAMPSYLSGSLGLGDLVQTASAFMQVQNSLGFFVTAYAQLAEWKAVINRLVEFESAMEEAERVAASATEYRRLSNDGSLRFENLNVPLTADRMLIAGATAMISPGARILLTGESGAGKSTLLRALAGFWPVTNGRILWPPDRRVLFLPQKPYLPMAELRNVMSYPNESSFDVRLLEEVLDTVSLHELKNCLQESTHWSQRLSIGEQQRLSIARALLVEPDFLFLDEATSALDGALEERMYALLYARLPHAAVVSVGHGARLATHHREFWRLERCPEGGSILTVQSNS